MLALLQSYILLWAHYYEGITLVGNVDNFSWTVIVDDLIVMRPGRKNSFGCFQNKHPPSFCHIAIKPGL